MSKDGLSGRGVDLSGEVVGERFRLERLLRFDNISSFYAAIDLETFRPLVARVLDAAPEFGERFTLRALVLCGINAPYVARLYAAVRNVQGTPVLLEAPFEGENLWERLAREPFALREVVAILKQLIEALGYVYQRDLIHGDLRPENLYIGQDLLGELSIQLRGVGYTALLAEQAPHGLSGLLYGDPLFTAPEQWVNRPIDVATDLYAVGALAYLMLSGETFIRPGPPFSVCRQHLSIQRPLLTHTQRGESVPAQLAHLIARASHPDRARRYQSLELFLHALEVAEHAIELNTPSAYGGDELDIHPVDASFILDRSDIFADVEDIHLNHGLSDEPAGDFPQSHELSSIQALFSEGSLLSEHELSSLMDGGALSVHTEEALTAMIAQMAENEAADRAPHSSPPASASSALLPARPRRPSQPHKSSGRSTPKGEDDVPDDTLDESSDE